MRTRPRPQRINQYPFGWDISRTWEGIVRPPVWAANADKGIVTQESPAFRRGEYVNLEIIDIELKEGCLFMKVIVEGDQENTFYLVLDADTKSIVSTTADGVQKIYAAQARTAIREHYKGQNCIKSRWF